MLKKIAFFIVLLLSHSYLLAQKSEDNPISQKLLKEIQKAAKDYLADFEEYTEKLSMSRNPKLKETCKDFLRKLFKPDAIIEVTSLQKPTPNTYSVERYLNTVANYTTRFSVVVFSIEITPVEAKDISPVKNNQGEIIGYKGTAKYSQSFCVKKEKVERETTRYEFEDFDVCEKTVKTVTFYYEKRYSPYLGSNTWIFLLGDIKAKPPVNLKTE